MGGGGLGGRGSERAGKGEGENSLHARLNQLTARANSKDGEHTNTRLLDSPEQGVRMGWRPTMGRVRRNNVMVQIHRHTTRTGLRMA